MSLTSETARVRKSRVAFALDAAKPTRAVEAM
jgi:hypothetical protein